jgi:hypothetical protein
VFGGSKVFKKVGQFSVKNNNLRVYIKETPSQSQETLPLLKEPISVKL